MFGREDITREILGNVPGWVATGFYVLAAVACGVAAWGFYRRTQRHRSGKREVGSALRPFSWRRLLAAILFQQEIRRDRFAGIAHLLVAYGFLILFWGTCLVFLEHDTPLHFYYGWFYQLASLLIDLGGLAFLVGLAMFLWRRHAVQRTPILKEWWVASLTWLLLAIGVSGFLLEGARIARDLPTFERWSIVGYSLALVLRGIGLTGEGSLAWHRGLWISHAAFCVAFFALLPWQFFAHMVYGAVSLARPAVRPRSMLPAPASGASPGAQTWMNLPRLDLVQTDACTTCGRCVEVCPAAAAGKPLSPRAVVLGIRSAIDAGGDGVIAAWVHDDALWSCTTCAACSSVCPVGIDIYEKIVELRRGRVEAGVVPDAAEQLLESVAEKSNPFGRANADRLVWSQGLSIPVAAADEPIELLYWIGCAGSFDPDGQSVARSMIKVLNHLKVNYRVLGCRERCTGDPARRLGEEGLFREQATGNLDTFRQHCVRKIITHCPHCWNTFRNEYPTLVDEATRPAWTVQHHTEFLAEMIAAGRLKPPRLADERITFHDPCYLGRGNGVTEPPREVLQQLAAEPILEMPRSRLQSFCCGAGGGAMWVDEPGHERVEHLRSKEAAATGASVVATGCPFCKVMLRTGLEATTSRPAAVRDVSELVVQAEGL
jgi:Fe-S oxidoreductase